MRFAVLPLLTAAFIITGCGAPTTPAASGPAAKFAASKAVEEGTLVFDKRIVYSAIDILGIGEVYNAKLEKAGIKTVNNLLLAGGTRTDRARLARETGISEKLLLTWINHADLMRVTGAGPEYARLLERAGIDTTIELARRNSINMVAKLREANDLGGGKKCVHRLPDVITTTKWVDNAKQFARLIKY